MSSREPLLRMVLVVLAGAVIGAGCPPAGGVGGDGAPRLGEIHFPTSGAPAARREFERGVLLLHSFEYDDAAAAFRAAERLDPGFAMAYWGEAMTCNHPIWHQQDREAARAVLGRLAATPAARQAKAPTAREKGYLAAVEALYGEGEKAARDQLFAAAMERLAASDPADEEAASFYALALLGTCESGRDVPTYMRAAAVAEEVFTRNPHHPGAVHYLIHAYDDPVHAPLGLRPARVYARIAPAAAHALHMPSHIFLALGMWDETVASNEASWAASEARRQRLGLALDERGYHALSWLQYAYLQQGRFADARKLLATMADDVRHSGSQRTREHLALMQAGYRVETRQWRADLGDLPDLAGVGDDLAAAALFAHGMAALEAGDPATARHDLERIEERLGGAGAPVQGGAGGHGGHARHGGSGGYGGAAAAAGGATGAAGGGTAGVAGGSAGVAAGGAAGAPPPLAGSAGILHAELSALLRIAEAAADGAKGTGAAAGAKGADGAKGSAGKEPPAGELRLAAVAEVERAAAAEDAMSYEFGPPVVVKPAHELAGELLLGLGRAAAARRHFELALARAPRRSLSLLGLARAAAQAGDRPAAERAYAELGRSWRRADSGLQELAELASFSAAR